MQRALITGGCGFIGVNLARALVADGWELLAFDNLSSGRIADALGAGFADVVVGEVADADALRKAADGVDCIVHLAAHTSVVESVEDPRHDVAMNVGGTLNALEAARANAVPRFVFASSNAPLGEVEPPTHEGVVPRPTSPYGASKLAGEALCSAYAGSYGMATVALRFSNVYGPFSYHKGSVIARFVKDVLDDRPLTIYGDGTQTRDFVYVDDLCSGIVAAASTEAAAGHVVHLGTGVETSVLQLVAALRVAFADREIRVHHEPARAGEIVRNFSDVSKARRLLGYRPTTPLEEGLARTRDWFLQAVGS